MQGLKGAKTNEQAKEVLQPIAEQEAKEAQKLVPTALRALADLKFVGLTSQWDMSTKLFHARFGGEMRAIELANVRPHFSWKGKWEMWMRNRTDDRESPAGNEADRLMQGFKDEADEAIYAAVRIPQAPCLHG